MMLPLLIASALTLVGAAVYTLIGRRYLRLHKAGSTLAWYAIFWAGIAAYAALDASWGLAVRFADPPLALGLLVLQLKILAGTSAFFGLVHHLVYVYTGKRGMIAPLLALYVSIYTFVVYSYAARVPIGQEARAWGSGLVYANAGGWVTDVAFILLFGPPLIASLAYVALLPRAKSREQRLRMLATTGAFVVFFGGLLLGWLTDVVPHWPLIEKCLALFLGLAVLRLAPQPDERQASDTTIAQPGEVLNA